MDLSNISTEVLEKELSGRKRNQEIARDVVAGDMAKGLGGALSTGSMSPKEQRLQQILAQVGAELRMAMMKFPSIHSPHEGYAVIKEELEELWDEIKPDKGREFDAMKEARQTAAMAIRYILDLS